MVGCMVSTDLSCRLVQLYMCFLLAVIYDGIVGQGIAEACHKRSVEEITLSRVYLQLCYSKGTGSY